MSSTSSKPGNWDTAWRSRLGLDAVIQRLQDTILSPTASRGDRMLTIRGDGQQALPIPLPARIRQIVTGSLGRELPAGELARLEELLAQAGAKQSELAGRYRVTNEQLQARLGTTEGQRRRAELGHSLDLEEALGRLEAAEQRSTGLSQVNSLLRAQLEQLRVANEALARELAGMTGLTLRLRGQLELRQQRPGAWTQHPRHIHLLWRQTSALRAQLGELRAATERGLAELQAEVLSTAQRLHGACRNLDSNLRRAASSVTGALEQRLRAQVAEALQLQAQWDAEKVALQARLSEQMLLVEKLMKPADESSGARASGHVDIPAMVAQADTRCPEAEDVQNQQGALPGATAPHQRLSPTQAQDPTLQAVEGEQQELSLQLKDPQAEVARPQRQLSENQRERRDLLGQHSQACAEPPDPQQAQSQGRPEQLQRVGPENEHLGLRDALGREQRRWDLHLPTPGHPSSWPMTPPSLALILPWASCSLPQAGANNMDLELLVQRLRSEGAEQRNSLAQMAALLDELAHDKAALSHLVLQVSCGSEPPCCVGEPDLHQDSRTLQQEQAGAQEQLAVVEWRLQREQQQRKALQQTCTHLEEQVAQVTSREQVLQQQLGRSLQAQEAQLDTLRRAVQDKASLAKEQAALAQLGQLASVEAADLRNQREALQSRLLEAEQQAAQLAEEAQSARQDQQSLQVELEQLRSDWEVQEVALKWELERMRQQVDQRERDRQLDLQRQAWVDSKELEELRRQDIQALSLREAERSLLSEKLSRATRELEQARHEAQAQTAARSTIEELRALRTQLSNTISNQHLRELAEERGRLGREAEVLRAQLRAAQEGLLRSREESREELRRALDAGACERDVLRRSNAELRATLHRLTRERASFKRSEEEKEQRLLVLKEARAAAQREAEWLRARLQRPNRAQVDTPLRRELKKLHRQVRTLEAESQRKSWQVLGLQHRLAEVEATGQARVRQLEQQLHRSLGTELPSAMWQLQPGSSVAKGLRAGPDGAGHRVHSVEKALAWALETQQTRQCSTRHGNHSAKPTRDADSSQASPGSQGGSSHLPTPGLEVATFGQDLLEDAMKELQDVQQEPADTPGQLTSLTGQLRQVQSDCTRAQHLLGQLQGELAAVQEGEPCTGTNTRGAPPQDL
ncbi:ciliary rootlet coiled-coil protein 2 [Ochotona princeps]|uniref:ciliary rootlet coiled-coil protein 2 n=1 Tax=Ochotona princeps TaxID=9978 RepID=UPI002714D5C1|nr:ciliary rootlet coiled-coil protein 2 [Ochotona princeps]